MNNQLPMYDTANDFDNFTFALSEEASGFFARGATVHIARAPGRLDVMGGIADYSGSLVAEMPIEQAALVGAQVGGTDDAAVVVRSLNAASEGLAEEIVLPAELFINPVSLLKFLRDHPPEMHWAGYVAGCFSLLRAEGLIPRGIGAKLLLNSTVPLGAGVSSSAAVEVSAMRAICAAFNISISGIDLAKMCQRVENDVMDAPCGIMDQVTATLGEAGQLLLLLCQPAEIQGTVHLPDGWSAFGIDSGHKHSTGGSAYTRTRVAAFMGYKILSDAAKSGFGGYLCNVTPEDYQRICALLPDNALPETMTGAEFAAKHGGIFDTVTMVNPKETYPIRAATEHPIFENDRVRRFVACLRDGSNEAMTEAGELMLQSHSSYSACSLGSDETDLLVQIATQKLRGNTVSGAKITGGGSGGTVCILVKNHSDGTVSQRIASRYQEQTGITPRIIRGTSPGAMATAVRRFQVS
jgi:L-arabinokinase